MSLIGLIIYCQRNNIQLAVICIAFDSLINRARNAAMAHFLSDEEATHLLFIDSDISFQPEDVIRLLVANKPVVGIAYAQKWLNQDALKYVYKQEITPPNPYELCSKVSVHLLDKENVQPLMEAEYVTTGFLMIQKEAAIKMKEAYPERKYQNDIDGYCGANPDMFYDLFPVEIHPETKRFESEDYGFSRLWRAIGGSIHVVTNASLTHHGWFGYQSNLMRQLNLAKSL